MNPLPINNEIRAYISTAADIVTIFSPLIIIGASIWKRMNIFAFIERKRAAKIKSIMEALDYQSVSGSDRTFFEEELNKELFMKVSEINAEKPFREKIYEICKLANGELTFRQLFKANPFLKLEKGKLMVQIKTSEHIDSFATVFFSIIMLIAAVITFLKWITVMNSIGLFISAIIFYGFSIFLWMTKIPYDTAKKIAPILEKLQDHRRTAV